MLIMIKGCSKKGLTNCMSISEHSLLSPEQHETCFIDIQKEKDSFYHIDWKMRVIIGVQSTNKNEPLSLRSSALQRISNSVQLSMRKSAQVMMLTINQNVIILQSRSVEMFHSSSAQIYPGNCLKSGAWYW